MNRNNMKQLIISVMIVALMLVASISISSASDYGTQVGSFTLNGVTVPAYSNGNNDYNSKTWSSYGLQYQCVEYVNRFYVQALGHTNMIHTGNANQYFSSASGRGLDAYPNGGTVPPQPGDILCSNGGSYGHVAIVREVTNNNIYVIHQNWANSASDNSKKISMAVSGGKYTISGFSSKYPVVGWLRKPGSTVITPSLPTSLTQYKSDGSTGLPLGGTTTENTVIMKGGVSDPSGNKVQLEVEIKPINKDFTGTPTFSSSLVTSGSTASVTCKGISDGQYHWQARAKNSKGITGPWLSAGGNAENMPDFVVSATPVTLKVSPSSGKQGTTFTFRGDGYTKKGKIEFHVRKPDNTEYPVTTLTASSSGALSYKYKSTTSSMIGTYTIWAVDKSTGRQSNTVTETIKK